MVMTCLHNPCTKLKQQEEVSLKFSTVVNGTLVAYLRLQFLDQFEVVSEVDPNLPFFLTHLRKTGNC